MTNDAFTELADTARRVRPAVALVLGSGMGDVAGRLAQPRSVTFAEIPGFPAATVAGHRGRLTLGAWAGKHVLVFEGRLHFYEGHPWSMVVLPVQTAQLLGARVLLLTNAAGGICADLAPGSLMAIRDHLEWTRPYCWRLPGPGALGPARPSPYSARLLDLLGAAARALGMELLQGIYAAVTGPSYETPAEIGALRAWGADAVGMSTAREIQAGTNAGLECAALSCITNRAAGLGGAPLDHQEVLTTAAEQGQRLGDLLEGFLQQLDLSLVVPPSGGGASTA